MVSVLQSEPDIEILKEIVSKQAKIVGDFAELGVYEGGSAKIICELKGDKDFYLFDTFLGLPKPSKYDRGFNQSDYACQSFIVKDLLKDYKNVYVYPGLFPLTTKELSHLKFSFVHFDGDLYQSCKDALEYFYPRLVNGGVILCHDFRDGVELAVIESGIPYEKAGIHAIISKP